VPKTDNRQFIYSEMGEFKCDICAEEFIYEEVLRAHQSGHIKADQYLYKFYLEKIKPTETDHIRPIRRKISKQVFLNKIYILFTLHVLYYYLRKPRLKPIFRSLCLFRSR